MRVWLLLLFASAPVLADDLRSAEIDAVLAAPEPSSGAPGLVPVPDFTGDWRSRRWLTGDWGGARTRWAEHGVMFALNWYQVAQGVVDGGIDETWGYVTNLDLDIRLDLAKMEVLPGALITFRELGRIPFLTFIRPQAVRTE